jgi:hypothetical protein
VEISALEKLKGFGELCMENDAMSYFEGKHFPLTMTITLNLAAAKVYYKYLRTNK